MSDELGWGDVEIGDELVTEEDVSAAESMGQMPIGKWLCTVKRTAPRMAQPSNYTSECVSINLKMCIDKAIEVDGKTVGEEESGSYEGRFIWDDVLMEHADEKAGMRKRRILVAKRFGLITGDQAITKKMWAEDIIGRPIIITTESQTYDDKFGVEQTKIKVAFNGYDAVADSNSGSGGQADNFDDI